MIIRTDATKMDDIKHGKEQERVCFPFIKAHFNLTDLKQEPETFKKWDYYCEGNKDFRIELKTREDNSTNPKIRAEGVFINTDKFQFNKYVVFNFLDEVWYYTVDANEYPTFRTRTFERQREGGCAENQISYIPFNLLKFMMKWTTPRTARGLKGAVMKPKGWLGGHVEGL